MRIYFIFFIITILKLQLNSQKCVWGDCINGKGKYIFDDGAIYIGDFKKGKLEGFGEYKDKYGNYYKGFFKNNKFDSVGILIRSDSIKYIGYFKNGKRHGIGTQYYPNKYVERGLWENDKFIKEAEFQDIVVKEPYSFCSPFLNLIKASYNNFSDIRGELINPLLKGIFYCTLEIKELTSYYFDSLNNFYGTYYKGNQNAEGKFYELSLMVYNCFLESCYKITLTEKTFNDKKINEFKIIDFISECPDVIGTTIEVILEKEEELYKVSLKVSKNT